jgi:hypothetical protein
VRLALHPYFETEGSSFLVPDNCHSNIFHMKTSVVLIATAVALLSGAFVHKTFAECCREAQQSHPAPHTNRSCYKEIDDTCVGECYRQDSPEEIECVGSDPANQCDTDQCEEQDVDYYDGKPSCIPKACFCTIPSAPTGTVTVPACLAKCNTGA